LNDKSVSRLHLRVEVACGFEITIEDLGSSNGTYVNDHPIPPGKPTPVVPGDVVRFGDVTLLFQGFQREGASVEMKTAPDAFVLEAQAMKRVLELVSRVAAGTLSVLILGETGVGKEVVARLLHAGSPRAKGPFVGLSCAALPEALLESELFGHEAGAFTGAERAKPGLFESASLGTLFLDEVGELPLPLQAKLLRVLEERQVLRLGALKPRAVDVRIVSATNAPLEQAVSLKRFRQDLYFRLNGFQITVPPLRERTDDIVPLARHFVGICCASLDRPKVPDLTLEVQERLRQYSWPGNVRELKNMIERAVLLCQEGPITVEHLFFSSLAVSAGSDAVPSLAKTQQTGLWRDVASLERDRIQEALRSTGGNLTRAADVLGISRRGLVNKMDRLKIPRSHKA
jgi:transcriptional regulator with PAS, ATPase and Fis domain